MIYFTSDLHFNHNREFIYESRGFVNVWDMNKEIVDNWNSKVKDNDIVYVLGDLMLGNNEKGYHTPEMSNEEIEEEINDASAELRIQEV